MIVVTRLNGSEIVLNPDQILTLESTPDTVVTMTNGEKLVIHETIPEITTAFMAYKKAIATSGPIQP